MILANAKEFLGHGVIVLMAGKGQAEALYGPGDEQRRNIVLRGIERSDQAFHAMAAQIAHQRAQPVVVMCIEKG